MPHKVRKMTYVSVILYHLTGGRAFRGSAESPTGFLKLTTIGRKSGQPRTVHLLYIRDGSAYVVTASNGGKPHPPGWLFNVCSNPKVNIQVQDRQVSAVAEIAETDKRRELWERLLELAPMYAGYEKQASREIPMVILRPVDEQRP